MVDIKGSDTKRKRGSERKREREKERESGTEKEREREREGGREGGREREERESHSKFLPEKKNMVVALTLT